MTLPLDGSFIGTRALIHVPHLSVAGSVRTVLPVLKGSQSVSLASSYIYPGGE